MSQLRITKNLGSLPKKFNLKRPRCNLMSSFNMTLKYASSTGIRLDWKLGFREFYCTFITIYFKSHPRHVTASEIEDFRNNNYVHKC
ncbi:unnamed protein product [Allacma fusca]|uniref:Uncharacterized protein n=1 Tax=Allacma fusca TaxID=39272 RepID=A0A8J2KPC2_9HEXA|nr:unnamed protein product [Allacma fusca]